MREKAASNTKYGIIYIIIILKLHIKIDGEKITNLKKTTDMFLHNLLIALINDREELICCQANQTGYRVDSCPGT